MKTQFAKPVLFVLVGLPGSGKSTWTKSFISTSLLHSGNREIVVISTDDILERYAVEYGISYNQAYLDYFPKAEKEMKQMVQKAFERHADIIWDQTNLGAGKRKKILNQTPKGYEKIAVVFEVDEQELTERLNRRAAETGKFIPLKVLESMKESYVVPSKGEGFNDIYRVNGG